MQLRHLKMMADGKRCAMFDVAVSQVKWLTESIWSGKFDPIKAHPYRTAESVPPKSPELKAFESKKGFMALGKFLGQMQPRKPKKKPNGAR